MMKKIRHTFASLYFIEKNETRNHPLVSKESIDIFIKGDNIII